MSKTARTRKSQRGVDPKISDQDIGKTCLQTIASIWQVDERAIEWVEGGFDWTPGSHLVRVRAEKSPTIDRWRVSVTTNFLTSVPIEDPKFIEAIAAFSGVMTSTYSMQYPPAEIPSETSNEENRTLSLFSSIYVDSDLVQWLPRFLAQEALVEVTNAEIQCVKVGELVGGKPHLVAGKTNKCPDEMLQVLSMIYVPKGQEPSRWTHTEEFVRISEEFGHSDLCFGMGDESGVTLETPFGDDSILIRLRPGDKHPQLGNGLLVTIQIPFMAASKDIAKWTALLNFAEANRWTDFPQLGCWVQHGDKEQCGLAHTSFVPNALYQAGLATNFAIWSIGRARWLRNNFFPNLKDKTMDEILSERLSRAALRQNESTLSNKSTDPA